MERDEYHVLSDVGIDHCPEGCAAMTRAELYDVRIVNAQTAGKVGVQLDLRLYLCLGRAGYPTGLGTALVLGHQPARSQDIRVVVIGTLLRFVILGSDEVGPAVGGRETISEQPRRTWMIFGWARPEDALLRIDSLVADAGIVGNATSRSQPQFGKDLARIGGEMAATTEPIS